MSDEERIKQLLELKLRLEAELEIVVKELRKLIYVR
jgi:hypothetical protein